MVGDFKGFVFYFYGVDGMGDVEDIFYLDMLLLKIEYVVNVLIRFIGLYSG